MSQICQCAMDAHINRLPPEMLSKIFLVCAHLWQMGGPNSRMIASGFALYDGTSHPFPDLPGLRWIAIAQVCQYWRSVALACGELWRELIFSSPEATTEMLRRSNGVALTVKAGGNYDLPAVRDNVRMVIPYVGRVSVLDLCFPPYLLEPLLHDIFVASPRLESFRLSISKVEPFDHLFKIPDFVFAGHWNTSSLRILELSCCEFPWQSLCLSALTHLTLREIAIPPTISQLLSVLRRITGLDTLVLDKALPLHNDTSLDITSPRLFFRHLRAITLRSKMSSCANFLAQIAYPVRTVATFDCETTISDIPDLHHFLQRTQSALRYGGGDHVFQSLEITKTYRGHVTLRCLVSCHSSAPVIPSQHFPQLDVTLSSDAYIQIPLSEVMRVTVVTLPLAEVQSLGLTGWMDPAVDWTYVIQHLPKIHTLHFGTMLPSELLEVLTTLGKKNKSTEPLTLLLPHLRSIWLSSVTVGQLDQFLIPCLQSRFQVGSTIQDLHLKNCWSLYEDDVERMKELVQDVDWDGVEQEEYSNYDYSERGCDFQGIYDSD